MGGPMNEPSPWALSSDAGDTTEITRKFLRDIIAWGLLPKRSKLAVPIGNDGERVRVVSWAPDLFHLLAMIWNDRRPPPPAFVRRLAGDPSLRCTLFTVVKLETPTREGGFAQTKLWLKNEANSVETMTWEAP